MQERCDICVNMAVLTKALRDGIHEKTTLTRVRGDVKTLEKGRLRDHSIASTLRR